MKRVELCVNRRLLDASFEGYKLGGIMPDPIRLTLSCAPAKAKPHLDHHSLLHARLHALHNALIPDPVTSNIYFVDTQCSIWAINKSDGLTLNRKSNPLENPDPIGEYPPCFSFCSPEHIILVNGSGRLVLMNVNNLIDASWEILYECYPLGENVGFTILDSKVLQNDSKQIHCLLYRIEPDNNHSKSVIEWIVLSLTTEKWTFQPYRKIECPAAIHYCAIEPGCESIFIAADKPLKFIKETNGESTPIDTKPTETKKQYCWIQSTECITITLQLRENLPLNKPIIITDFNSIDIQCEGIELLKGSLSNEIEYNLTTWNMDKSGKLSVLLLKKQPGIIWQSLLKDGDLNGEQIMDPALVAEVHERLAHLCSETEVISSNDAPLFNSQQLEECDYVAEEESCLVRLQASTYDVTHQVFLSAHQIILNVQLSSTEVKALGLRYDADTCIWQPRKSIDGNWEIKHEGTLLAFGYIQSSKEQKKYTICSPNMEYCVVCEPNRHCFIYKQGEQSSQLRHRMPGGDTQRVKIGKQQLISLDRDEDIMGIYAANDLLYLLTEKSVIAFDMTI